MELLPVNVRIFIIKQISTSRITKTVRIWVFTAEEWKMVELLVDRLSLLAALIKEWEHAETCTLNMVFPYLIQVRKEFQGCEDDLSEQLRVSFEKQLNCYFGSVEINKTFIIASFFDVRTKKFEYSDMTWRDAA